MNEPLHVLIIEDSEDDALLVLRTLRRGNFHPIWERIQTAAVLRNRLANHTWDVVISDYRLPGFDAPTALQILQASQLDIPFIVVSGTVGEEAAVEMMKAGAHDYVMKDNLTRLSEAVRRELREARVRAERRQVEVAMKRQLAAIEAAIDSIAILQEDIYLYVNQAHLKLFGYDRPEELIGKTWKLLYSSEEIERFERDVFPILERDRAWQGEAIATRKDGSTFAQGVSLTLTEDGLLISVCRDITDIKQAQELLIHNALHDPLTGLPNRTLLSERLEFAIHRARGMEEESSVHRKCNRYAILFLDLDRFKVVNDSLGHWVGDRLLIAIAQRLKQQLQNIDLVARLGGDEFVILLEEIDNPEAVIQVAQRILESCQTPFIIDEREIFTSFSIGIVLGSKHYHQAADVIRDADIAMYRAKTQGGNTYKFFDATMHTQVMHRLTLETDLRKALDREEFIVYYQPIFTLGDRKLAGFEALVRWQHPMQGFVSPGEFIPFAEETGLIVAIDRWVFQQACQQMATWKQKFTCYFPLKIGINLSVHDLYQPRFTEAIDRVLSETGLEGSAIVLEITESILIKNIGQTISLLNQLKSRNIQIGIDDFGTGYSSLGYLHRFPVDNLKIDRSFVHHLRSKNRKSNVVNAIVALAKQLDLSVTAEGIETESQLEWLRQLGCDFGQGYLFSKPLPASEIESIYFTSANQYMAYSVQTQCDRCQDAKSCG